MPYFIAFQSVVFIIIPSKKIWDKMIIYVWTSLDWFSIIVLYGSPQGVFHFQHRVIFWCLPCQMLCTDWMLNAFWDAGEAESFMKWRNRMNNSGWFVIFTLVLNSSHHPRSLSWPIIQVKIKKEDYSKTCLLWGCDRGGKWWDESFVD